MEGAKELSKFNNNYNKAITFMVANYTDYNTPPIESETDELGRFTGGSLSTVLATEYYNGYAGEGFTQGIKVHGGNTYLYILKQYFTVGETEKVKYELFAGSIQETNCTFSLKSSFSGTIYGDSESEISTQGSSHESNNINVNYSYTYGSDRATYNVYSIGYAGGIITQQTEDKIHIRTDVPIFDNKDSKVHDYIYNYLLSGDTSHAIKPPFDKLDLKTDWTVYIDGESHPSVKVVWRNERIEENDEYLNNSNACFIVSDYRSFQDIHDPMLETEILATNKFTDKYLLTSFDEMYETAGISSAPLAKKKVTLYMSLCYDVEYYSTWLKVSLAITGKAKLDVFGSIVLDYGLPSATESYFEGNEDDGSTVTIIFGSGENDNGYEDGEDDIENEDDIVDLNVLTSLTRIYKMTQQRIESLGANLWSHEFYELISKINVSPLENILSLRMLPFNVSGVESEVVLGNFHTKVNGERVRKSNFERVKIGEVEISPYYRNFLDLSPYSRMSIYLPYAGFKEIDASLFYEKILSVYYAMDIISGGCLIEIYADNLKHYEFNTQIGVDIPISSSNRARIEGLFAVNTTVGTALGSLNGIEGAIKGGVTAGLNAAESQFHFNTSSTPNPSCVGSINRQCFVQIDYPNYQDVKRFNSTMGRICMLGKRIGDLSGFTVCDSNINLSNITATSDEKNELSAILSSGFFA